MIHAVINPAGAGGKTMKAWLQAEKILHEKNASYEAHFSALNHNINDIVHELSSQNEEVNILLFGGDGTMNLAVNAIADFEKTKIGYVPCGSGNDLARALKIPQDVKTCIERVLENNVIRQLDVGEVICHDLYDRNGILLHDTDLSRRFNISSGIGFDAEICANVESGKIKKMLNPLGLGKLSYIAEAVRVIFNARRAKTEMILDHNETLHFDQLLFTAAMNTAYEGGGFMFGPDADPCDGLLEIAAADGLSRVDFFRMFPYAYTGSHVKFEGVTMKRAKEVEIITDQPLWVHTDGEIIGMSSHITFCMSKEKMRMLV